MGHVGGLLLRPARCSGRPWLPSRRFLRVTRRHRLQRREERSGVEHRRRRRREAACGHGRVNRQCLRRVSVQSKAHRKVLGHANLHGAGGTACFSKRGSRLRTGRGRLDQQKRGCRLGLEGIKAGHSDGTARRESDAADRSGEGSVTGCQMNAHGRPATFDSQGHGADCRCIYCFSLPRTTTTG